MAAISNIARIVFILIEEICYYSEVKSFTTAAMPVPTAVDLGLSVKWASFNLGASKPSEYGYYYSWAETSPRTCPESYKYKWCNNTTWPYSYTKYTIDSGEATMELADDAARVNLKGSWRLPTSDEWVELKENCNFDLEEVEGVYGMRITSKNNSNSIFIPWAGYSVSDYSYPKTGENAGIMLSTYESDNKCRFGKVPVYVDYESCAMMSSLFSVRAVQ